MIERHGQALDTSVDERRPQVGLQGRSTRAVHAGLKRRKPYRALVDPIFQSSAFTFDSLADARQFQEAHARGEHQDRFEYTRVGNPTVAAAEAHLAALEHAESALQVASGMAAVAAVLLNLVESGSHIVLTDDCYRHTRQLCLEYLKRFGVSCTIVPVGDYAALEAAIRPETHVLLSETPTNPFLRIVDVQRFAEIGKRRRIVSVIDATFATPINLRPLDWGVDLVIHSATKYLGGHNDLVAGFVAGPGPLIAPIRASMGLLGGVSDPHTAYLVLRGMKTLALRVQQQNRSGQQVAEFLAAHPAVERVWYPGLASHPDHAIAAQQMSGFGGVVSFTVRGDVQASERFIDALRLPYISPSLGGTESLVLHPASMMYGDYLAEDRQRLGIADNLVRLALGIEDARDLIDDLQQALAFALR